MFFVATVVYLSTSSCLPNYYLLCLSKILNISSISLFLSTYWLPPSMVLTTFSGLDPFVSLLSCKRN